VRLFEVLSRWLGRVEIALAFADDALREGEQALARGDAVRAEAAAKIVLERVPGSVLALALLADARAAAGLTEDLADTLEELAARVPSRAEVWARLAAARRTLGAPAATVREAYVRALGVAAPGSEVRREALLALCDLDLDEGDVGRAELWLAGLAPGHLDVALRSAEVSLAKHDPAAALRELRRPERKDGAADATDGRLAFALARALALSGDADVFAPATRAYLLDVPGASELLSSALAWIPTDEATRARLRSLVEARGEADHARWRAAFARAEGRRDEARAALRDALAGGDATAALPLLEAAIDDRDTPGLLAALAAIPAGGRAALAEDAAALAAALALDENAAPNEVDRSFAALTRIEGARTQPFAEELVRKLVERFVPREGTSRWPLVLARLDMHARALHDLDGTARAAALAVESARPVRLAIVGEFNAGKSTFVNALIGQDVAPTGVLPTTATLHHLRYGPDPLARIELEETAQHRTRIVPLSDLRRTIEVLGEGAVRRVDIELPLAFLTRVEVLDTPGFNAPNARHTEAARRALEEADVLLWLLDASQPLKQSERVVLDEARAAKIPVQILIGKSDRVPESERSKILGMVERALAETGLASIAPPVLFSARLALAGKLGQEGALEKSAWPEVQHILDEDVIARSDVLKERALRRRAHALVVKLGEEATERARREAQTSQERANRSRALGAAAGKIERDTDSLAAALARSLEPAGKELERDLAVTVVAPTGDADGTLLRYRTERALGRLAPTLATAMAGIAEGTGLAPSEFAPLSKLLVRTVATAAKTPLGEPLARAAVLALAEHLRGLALSPVPETQGAPLERELRAFAEALA
jgi:small GTP-binding protein